jgi:hypothetical protein
MSAGSIPVWLEFWISVSLVGTQRNVSVNSQIEMKGTVVMKYVSSIAVSTAVVCLVGCASSAPLPVSGSVGPAPTQRAKESGSSSLQVYSARVRAPVDLNKEEFLWNNDFGKNDFLYEPAHSDYTIYTQDGKVFEHVKNARNYEDPQPAKVSLPPGTYRIEARARNFGWVTIPVVVEPHKLTVVNLQRGANPVVASVDRNDAVLLGGERIVGWRANLAAHP